jgi:hypothetical protein
LQGKDYIPNSGKADIPDIYAWLKDNHDAGAVAILPLQQGNLTKYDTRYGDRRLQYKMREFQYMYYSIFAGFPKMVNGAGGFTPPVYFKLRDAINNLTDEANKTMLKELEINTFIIHYDRFEPEDWERWNSTKVQQAGLKEVVRFGNDAVYIRNASGL